ncbi:MAG: 50S ribosomal protein L9 [Candidatus Moranbacteria bacterium]|jgi:large subunit ribosomal protein L9|nr:50S ribosomal protein L9 [Candidatus Moranbacteria bacterium]MBP9801214.1 50S ribosomal protein L9 [Candidatus Moranbacteria bacterium]
MKVILMKDNPKIGKVGDVKEVASGYALNFLLPHGIAKVATPAGIKQVEELKRKRVEEIADEKRSLLLQANALRDRSVVIRTKAEEGRLFGSVGAEEITAALSAEGIEIDPKILDIPKAFKLIGQYEVKAHFGKGVEVSFEVKIQSM